MIHRNQDPYYPNISSLREYKRVFHFYIYANKVSALRRGAYINNVVADVYHNYHLALKSIILIVFDATSICMKTVRIVRID